MLYNPAWKPTTDLYALESLIAWLERQPRNTEYDYAWCQNCVIGQYLAAHGIEHGFAMHYGKFLAHHSTKEYGLSRAYIADGSLGFSTQWTFGQALQRARAVQKAKELEDHVA